MICVQYTKKKIKQCCTLPSTISIDLMKYLQFVVRLRYLKKTKQIETYKYSTFNFDFWTTKYFFSFYLWRWKRQMVFVCEPSDVWITQLFFPKYRFCLYVQFWYFYFSFNFIRKILKGVIYGGKQKLIRNHFSPGSGFRKANFSILYKPKPLVWQSHMDYCKKGHEFQFHVKWFFFY